jgi:hypothetical protein
MEATTSVYMAGFAWSYAINAIINGVLVVFKALSPDFKSLVTSILGHHWATHGAFILIFFLVLGFIFSAMGLGARQKASTLSWVIAISTMVGGLIILGFGLTEVL